MSAGPLLMGVESAEGDIHNSSASAREREYSGRLGVQNSEGLLRLDAEPQCIVLRQMQAQMGPCKVVDLFTSRLIKQLPQFYS